MAIASNLTGNSVNNGRRTPFQGFDVSIYVQDQATGTLIPFGEFTGFQHVVRNASEPYLPLGNRTMNILDGEFQIGWVAEQGKINLEAMRHVFGFSVIGPVVRLGRSPRFQIVVEYNAPDLEEKPNQNNQFLYNDLYANSLNPTRNTYGDDETEPTAEQLTSVLELTTQVSNRVTAGRYVFGYCKIDAFTTGIMAGRTAVADRIEGLAETWYWRPFTGGETPVSKKIVLDNEANQKSYFKGSAGFTPLQIPAWAYESSGTVYKASGT
jgi:hypothetical protein